MNRLELKWCWYSGIAAVVIYLIAVVVGGILYPGYSHISQDISQLTSTNSPIRDLMNVFIVYNVLVAIFGFGLWRISHNKLSKIASLFIISIGALGAVITWFTINTRGTDITFTGIVHIGIVSIVSLLTVLAGFMFWRGMKKTDHDYLAKPSLWAGILFLVSGPIAAVGVESKYAGLLERIPIGVFLAWISTVSVLCLVHSNHEQSTNKSTHKVKP